MTVFFNAAWQGGETARGRLPLSKSTGKPAPTRCPYRFWVSVSLSCTLCFTWKAQMPHNTLSAGIGSPTCEWVSPSLCVPLHRITISANCFHHGIVLTNVPASHTGLGLLRSFFRFQPLSSFTYAELNRYVKPGAFSEWAAPDHHIYTVPSTVYT